MLRKSVTVALSLTIVGIVLVFAYARARTTPLPLNSVNESPEAAQGSEARVEAELLLLRSTGFHPKEITRPPGQFLLALQNHSNEEEVSFTLSRDTGSSMKQVRMPKRQSKLKEFLHLPPGRYVLAETNHPEWNCTIVITPH